MYAVTSVCRNTNDTYIDSTEVNAQMKTFHTKQSTVKPHYRITVN